MRPEDSKSPYAGLWVFLNDRKMCKTKKTQNSTITFNKIIALGRGIENQEYPPQEGGGSKESKRSENKFHEKKNHKM